LNRLIRAPRLFHEAIQLYTELYHRNAENATGETCLRAMRLIFWELSQLDRNLFPIGMALTFSQEIVRRHPLSSEAWDELSELQARALDWSAAYSAATMAIRLDPTSRRAWGTLGNCYLALGQPACGRWCLEHQLELAPRDAGDALDVFGLSGTALLLGRYADGWRWWAQSNEAHLQGQGKLPTLWRPLVGRPRWAGEPITGRLLLYIEHGHGDAFMILR
jgi:tetratricopeptide (TPR) repeat protein